MNNTTAPREMTRMQRQIADKIARAILHEAFHHATDEHCIREGVVSAFVNYERMSYCTFSKGGVDFEVTVTSRRSES